MKTLTKRIATALLALLVLLSGIFAITATKPQKADASAAIYPNASLYYFTDYYPTLSREMLEREFGTPLPVVWDHKYVNSETFTEMVLNGYFSQNSYRVAVIDIKTFIPDPKVLLELFANLKELCNITVFVSAYEKGFIEGWEFFQFVDFFISDTRMVTLSHFMQASLEQLADTWSRPIGHTAYMIDKNLIPLHTQEDWDQFQKEGIVYLFRHSPLLRQLVWKLCFLLKYKNLPKEDDREGSLMQEDYQHYVRLADFLFTEANISFVSCFEDNICVDLFTKNVYKYETDRYLPAQYVMDKINNKINFLCAFGFWELDRASYDIWRNMQYGEGYHLPVYILAVEEIAQVQNGLNIITDADLKMQYRDIYEERDVASDELLDFLRDVLLF